MKNMESAADAHIRYEVTSMRKKSICLSLSVFVVMFLISACVATMREPSPSDISTWDYGSEPVDYKNIILSQPALKTSDVDSPRIEFQGAPKKMWVPAPGYTGFYYGWGGFVKRFGAKSGSITFRYIIKDSIVIFFEEANDYRTFKI